MYFRIRPSIKVEVAVRIAGPHRKQLARAVTCTPSPQPQDLIALHSHSFQHIFPATLVSGNVYFQVRE